MRFRHFSWPKPTRTDAPFHSQLVIADFLRRRTCVNEAGCWLFMGQNTAKHPSVWLPSQNGPVVSQAHRLSAFVATGVYNLPPIFVCHHCDVPQCINPEHLYFGDSASNIRDMHRRGRYVKYDRATTRHKVQKTCDTDAKDAIDRFLRRGHSLAQISQDLGIHKASLRFMLRGDSYTHLHLPRGQCQCATKLPRHEARNTRQGRAWQLTSEQKEEILLLYYGSEKKGQAHGRRWPPGETWLLREFGGEANQMRLAMKGKANPNHWSWKQTKIAPEQVPGALRAARAKYEAERITMPPGQWRLDTLAKRYGVSTTVIDHVLRDARSAT